MLKAKNMQSKAGLNFCIIPCFICMQLISGKKRIDRAIENGCVLWNGSVQKFLPSWIHGSSLVSVSDLTRQETWRSKFRYWNEPLACSVLIYLMLSVSFQGCSSLQRHLALHFYSTSCFVSWALKSKVLF